MKSNNLLRQRNALIIPEGFYQEPYTPIVGRIVSPVLNKKLKYAKMILSADADVTFRDAMGNAVSTFALSKGPQPFLVSEISAVSAGSVLIVHDGEIDTTEDENINL